MATRRLRFSQFETVRLSIITLVLKDPNVVLASLASLLDTIDSSIAYEVIIVCNGLSKTDVSTLERFAVGTRLIVCEENTGFSGGCNIGAAAARAPYLLFLNDDTLVEPGSVASLIRAADEESKVAAVGSMMLFPDGTIQECGSIMWRDGSTMPVGRGASGTSIRYGHRRRVDYCSACSLLVRREAFDAVGGFDESYFPAYYEDTDFALKLRAAGWQIMVEPQSRVRHLEAASTPSRFRQFLFKRNRQRFLTKWGSELLAMPQARPSDLAAVERAIQLARGLPIRVLVCDDRLPVDDVGSGYRRMLELLDDLADPRYAITFSLSATLEGDHTEFFSRGIEITDEPLERYLTRPGMAFDIVIVSRPHNFERWASVIRAHLPTAVLIYDTESLFHRRIYLQAEFAKKEDVREGFLREARAMEQTERSIARASDRMVCIATEELTYVEAVHGHAPIDLMRPVLRNVDRTTRGFDERTGVFFVAGWLAGPNSPNVDGFLWFVREVWPIVREAIPGIRFFVTGGNPPDNVREHFGDDIIGLGRVVDLHNDVYQCARVVVAPIRFGAGVKNKTMEAIQSCCPTVATRVGAEGMNLVKGETIDICDDPVEFARSTIALLAERAHWESRRRAIADLLDTWSAESQVTWATVIERALKVASSPYLERDRQASG